MTTTPNKEVCELRIMFPVDSGEQTLDIRRKIQEVLAELPDYTMTLTLTDMKKDGQRIR